VTESPRRPEPIAPLVSSPAPAPPDPEAARLARYYRERAAEYDRIYRRPERQEDLHRLEDLVCRKVSGRNVLELACGTGWWTEVMARSARSITATDLNESVVQIATRRDFLGTPVTFRLADAWDLFSIPGVYDTIFAGFWLSHLSRSRIESFLRMLDDRLGHGGRVILLDNRYVEGSSTPVSRTDDEGNTYQIRTLEDGREFEVRKNFLAKAELMDLLDRPHRCAEVRELRHYWVACYDTGTIG
jgi:SAM-dependent methyltransferase